MEKKQSEEKAQLFLSGLDRIDLVEQRIRAAFQQRLTANPHYSAEEAEQITRLTTALFPIDFELSPSASSRFRSLARLSQCGLQPFQPRSHRKILGPFIIGAKKLVWRFVAAQLDDALRGIEEFCSWTVVSEAKQLVQTERIKKRLDLPDDEPED